MEKIDQQYQLVKKLTVYLIFLIALIFGLIQAKSFLAPVFFAVLLAYLLYPIASLLERNGFPRISANLLSILIGLLVVTGVIYFFSQQFSVFTADFPEMKKQASKNLQSLEQWLSAILGVSDERIRNWLNESTRSITTYAEILETAFKITSSTILVIGLMPVYVFFMLYYRSKFHDFVLKMAPDRYKNRTIGILDKINKVTQSYMSGVFIVVFILSILHSIGFSIIGLEYPVLLGVTAAFFNFIPYFGTLIGAAVPLLYTLLAMDSLHYTLGVIIYFLIIQFTENNILTPNITGGSVRLNPFATILSLIVGSMVWGVAGMFMVIPFLAMFKIFCEHFHYLEPVAFLLSNRGTDKHAITWDKIRKRFNRG